jgi:hypothetical protein
MSDTAIFVWLIAAALTFLAALTVLITVAVVMVDRDRRDLQKRVATGWPREGCRPPAGSEIERRGGGSAPRSSLQGEQ